MEKIAPVKQEYQPLGRTLKDVCEYISNVKMMKNHNYNQQQQKFIAYQTPIDNGGGYGNGCTDELFVEDLMSNNESLLQQKWSAVLSQLNYHSIHLAHDFIRVEWPELSHVPFLNNHSHIFLINELFELCTNMNTPLVDVCINGTRCNIGLKYELMGDEEATLWSLTQVLNTKRYAYEWCFNRMIKMKMTHISMLTVNGSKNRFVFFEFQGMNPFVSVDMVRLWFEQKLILWRFEYLDSMEYKDGAVQYLVKPNKFSVTNHAEIFVYDHTQVQQLLQSKFRCIFDGKLNVRMIDSKDLTFRPWIHSERVLFHLQFLYFLLFSFLAFFLQ